MQIDLYEADRRLLLPLFALADDSPLQIARYIDLGEILVARSAAEIAGHLQLIWYGDGTAELKSIAVAEARQGAGIGRSLVAAAIERSRQRGVVRLIVSTAAADTGNLRFYQRQGFRMSRIVRDAFGPSNGYAEGMLVDAIPLRDLVWLDLDLPD